MLLNTCEDLVPYINFVRGVVYSNSLPNFSLRVPSQLVFHCLDHPGAPEKGIKYICLTEEAKEKLKPWLYHNPAS